MRQRGRKSASAVVIPGGFGQNPAAPAELTPRQAEIWREVTASEALGFFATAALRGLLADYCSRREAAEHISAIINEFKTEWLKSNEGVQRYKQLLQMRDLEVRGVAALATKLRLTNQSRYTTQSAATAARNAPRGPRPWEYPWPKEPA